jgi:hypothetical protein
MMTKLTFITSVIMASFQPQTDPPPAENSEVFQEAIREIMELDCSFGQVADDLTEFRDALGNLIAKQATGAGGTKQSVQAAGDEYRAELRRLTHVDPEKVVLDPFENWRVTSTRMKGAGDKVVEALANEARFMDAILEKWRSVIESAVPPGDRGDMIADIDGFQTEVQMTAAAGAAVRDMREIIVQQYERKGVEFRRTFYGTAADCRRR